MTKKTKKKKIEIAVVLQVTLMLKPLLQVPLIAFVALLFSSLPSFHPNRANRLSPLLICSPFWYYSNGCPNLEIRHKHCNQYTNIGQDVEHHENNEHDKIKIEQYQNETGTPCIDKTMMSLA